MNEVSSMQVKELTPPSKQLPASNQTLSLPGLAKSRSHEDLSGKGRSRLEIRNDKPAGTTKGTSDGANQVHPFPLTKPVTTAPESNSNTGFGSSANAPGSSTNLFGSSANLPGSSTGPFGSSGTRFGGTANAPGSSTNLFGSTGTGFGSTVKAPGLSTNPARDKEDNCEDEESSDENDEERETDDPLIDEDDEPGKRWSQVHSSDGDSTLVIEDTITNPSYLGDRYRRII